ncbi:uncharacterized protein LOC8284463 isoform X2 [Ricinus communis]|uniref:Myb-like domain-containing protein n=2 Tax=Ricinus communis TaxID=3988 RepID=B9RLR9_RICCO|nr:uncharacterized protein LOC8284463 isoform X2 [Ricinus communis]XP_048229121.1 uncharacterized protein LOC8284463 isoform X2 [Ricinus communis]EEF47794.1 hypothetical protein RCOM_1470460 [Ricinus communis]|eukprot:XP_015572089.1 uncharacterized protein LOC8284463 isoform X2 [Ricinus communis]
MVQKRPFYNEELDSISSKHQRQVEYNNQLVSFPEFVPLKFASSISYTPDYLSPEHPLRTGTHHQGLYSLLLHYPPQEAVPIGSNYQAEIPEWSPHDSKSKLKSSGTPGVILDANLASGEKDENRLMGTCVIPMPDFKCIDEVGNVKNDCSCLDEGSIRCVRQHILKAREKVKRVLGMERFKDLGFCDMGEAVSENWTEEEEQLFHEVVFSNPVSLGKNFWSHLSAAFPFRTKKDIVCYYFNVFMLQRRAEQNRCKSMSIYDSDNDEWHESDDYDGSKCETTEEDEEDEDSVESSAHKDNLDYNQSQKHDISVLDEGAEYYAFDDLENLDFGSDRDIPNFLETCPMMSFDDCGSNLKSHLLEKLPSDEMLDEEVQDVSWTSSISSPGSRVKADSDDLWPCSFNEVSCGSGKTHFSESCDVKIWDAGYMICPKSKVDLLPTCSMIEEVFGDGSWNYKGKRCREPELMLPVVTFKK